MLKHKVLATQLTSLADARFFAAHGVDWIGFTLSPEQPSSISPEDFQEIKNWIEGPAIAARFVNAFAKEIEDAITMYNLDAVILDADTTLDVIQEGLSATIFKEIDIATDPNWARTLEWAAPFVDYFIIKLPPNNTDNQLTITELCGMYDIFLEEQNNGLSPKTIKKLQPTGIVANAIGPEEVVGMKSFEDLDPLFEYLQDGTI